MRLSLRSIALASGIAATVSLASIHADELPSRREILKSLTTANDYFMAKFPDPGAEIDAVQKKKIYPSNIWTRGVYYEGLMALHDIYPESRYYQYAVDWGKAHNWSFRRGPTTRDADNYCAAQTYLQLYEFEPRPERIRDTLICMNMLVNTPQNGDWSWIDAIQMGMPVLVKVGVMKNDPRYFEKAYQMYSYTKRNHGDNGLYNPADGLWWRDKDFDPPYTEPNGEDSYWSRGNGWVVAALARVLAILPEDASHRDEYIADLKAMLVAVKKVQREDGFWNVSLHDPSNYGGKEATGTALFVYGMAWAINNGFVSAEEYMEPLTKGWNAIAKESIHGNGFLGWVQSTGKEPKDGQPLSYDREPDFEDYGLGCVLLAGAEVYKLK